ncbi:hypothetical protein KC675_03365 [Candidatus Dojkabacteria bacterium]|uniref:Uncharacterized protein n=1 Tax=Candidatus Dojkabacteria bacterium TaxID=2099670 RepID=A0A955L139_9BACT|nr:hypothetical protein [Candidatus Dojkabacteria bacterium]
MKKNSTKFVKKGKYDDKIFLDKSDFVNFCEYLEQAGLNNQLVKIPLNEVTSERSTGKPIELSKFLEIDRNYKAFILIASNERLEIRILFRNLTKEVYFRDDIFPSAGSNSRYNYYVSGDDIREVYPIDLFIQEYLKNKSVSRSMIKFSYFGSIGLLFVVMIINSKLDYSIENILLSLVIIFTILSWTISFFDYTQTGVYFHSPENAKKTSAAIANLKDNWIIMLATSLLTFVGSMLLSFMVFKLGWI